MAVAVLGILGAVFGLILAYASKVFAVEKDPREEAILGCLPGANCGGCGFPGCGGYAAAVAAGESVKKVATVHCSGGGADKSKYEYIGIHDCLAAARLPGGGPLACKFGCLGMGSCESECPFDAIHVKDGVAVVDDEKCVACGKCVDICPRHIIDLEPYKTKKHVSIPCSSKDKGPAVTKVCSNGCIGCALCAKACPKEAITIENNLARIDYSKCIGCTLCAQKCPRKLIVVDGKVPVVKPAAPKAAPAAAATKPASAPAAPAAETKASEAPKAEETKE